MDFSSILLYITIAISSLLLLLGVFGFILGLLPGRKIGWYDIRLAPSTIFWILVIIFWVLFKIWIS